MNGPYERITHQQWTREARKQERAARKGLGPSWTATTISTRARHAILEIESAYLLVRPDWRDALRQAAEQKGTS